MPSCVRSKRKSSAAERGLGAKARSRCCAVPSTLKRRSKLRQQALIARLYSTRNKLRQRAEHLRNNKSDAAAKTALEKARISLRVEINLVRAVQRHHMPALGDDLQAEDDRTQDVSVEDLPEETPLYLPSSFTAAQRLEYGLTSLAEKEMKIRRCYAESELEQLKLSIRLILIDVRGKRKDTQGIARLTRANAKLKQDIKRRDKHMARYNVHFKALVELGYDMKNRHFQLLTSETMNKVRDMTAKREVGEGKRPDAWFWREAKDVASISEKNQEELMVMNEEGTHTRADERK